MVSDYELRKIFAKKTFRLGKIWLDTDSNSIQSHGGIMGVEAELGHVGMGDQYDSLGGQRIGFTDPE